MALDKLSSMSAFVKVAEIGSFAEAARQMGLSRSQVNRMVIQLEDFLGVTLLNRTTRHVGLTPTGQAYLEKARLLLQDIQEVEQSIQSEYSTPSGEIRINAPMSFGTLHLNGAIVAFMKRFPDIKTQLLLTDEIVDPHSSDFDITVRIAEPSESPSLIEHVLFPVPRILCASPEFIERHGEPKSIEELRTLSCLHYGSLPAGNRWKLFGPEGETIINVTGAVCSNNGEVLRDAAVEGLGIALLPTFIAGRELQVGRLTTVLHNYQASTLSLCVVYPPNRHLSERIRVFVKFIQDFYGDLPPWDFVK